MKTNPKNRKNNKNKKKKNITKNIARKWKRFFSGFKKFILAAVIITLLVLVIPAGYAPDAMVSKGGNVISELTFLGDRIDDIRDFVEELRQIVTKIFQLIAAVDSSFLDEEQNYEIDLQDIPEYSGTPYAVLNQNKPAFTKEEITNESYEFYEELDLLGRCGVTEACIGRDIMPTEERGAIGMVKPSGWKLKKYDIVDGKYIYNRCHLIGFQLTGENANVKNLITGTRYLNVEGMLPFENQVADYVKKTGNHVMYRVTPIFEGNNLVASGVQMEAYSVEDRGIGICFNVYIYNVQPGIEIDYATGDNWLAD